MACAWCRVRYYAAEALYNVAKSLRGQFMEASWGVVGWGVYGVGQVLCGWWGLVAMRLA